MIHPRAIILAAAFWAIMAPAAWSQELIFTGNSTGLWLVRASRASLTFDVAFRPADLAEWRTARAFPGRPNAAIAAGTQLNVLLGPPPMYLALRGDDMSPAIGASPDDPRWGRQSPVLAAFESVRFGPETSPTTIAVVPLSPAGSAATTRPDGKTAPAGTVPVTAATTPAPVAEYRPLAARTRPAGEFSPSSPPALPEAPQATLAVFQNTRSGWAFVTELDAAAMSLGPCTRLRGAVAGGRLYLLYGEPSAQRLLSYHDSIWEELPLPPADSGGRTLDILTIRDSLVLMQAIKAAALEAQAQPSQRELQLARLDANHQYELHKVLQNGSPVLWDANNLPLAAGLREQVMLLWRQDSNFALASCSPTGDMLPASIVQVFAPQEPSAFGEDIMEKFLLAALAATALLSFLLRPRQMIKPFSVPPLVQANVLGRRLLAAIIDYVPISTIAWAVFLPPMTVQEVMDLANQKHLPQGVAFFQIASVLSYTSYCILMESRFGGTLGKLMLRLTVAGDEGRRPTLGQVALRNVSKIIELLCPVPGGQLLLLLPLLNRNRQRLGDMLARTTVVDARSLKAHEAAAASNPPPPPGSDNQRDTM